MNEGFEDDRGQTLRGGVANGLWIGGGGIGDRLIVEMSSEKKAGWRRQ